MNTPPRTAYGDECFRETQDRTGFYLLAAALVDDEEAESVRATLMGVRARRASKLHWKDLTDGDRFDVAKLVADLPAVHVVVVGAPLGHRRQERGRRLALRHMLAELPAWGVDRLLLESRPPTLNKRDIDTVTNFYAGNRSTSRVKVDHVRPSNEPLAWLADAVAGACAAARLGRGDWLGLLQDAVVEFDVDLDGC